MLYLARQVVVLASCLVCVFAAARACAAPDDGEQVENPAGNNVHGQILINRDQFDQWMFQGTGSASAARARVNRSLELRLAVLERKHQLTEAQTQKLKLAARGDLNRLFDEVEQLRAKFREAQQDPNQLGQMWQLIQPLQKHFTSGPFGPSSLFAKVLSRTLSAEQNAAQEAIQRERRTFRYRACIETSVAMLEDTVPLRNEQREKLIQLLVEKTAPPASFGQYDYFFVMYQLARIDPGQLEEFLDERQRNQLQAHLQQMRGMRQMLVQTGAMAEDDDADDKAQPR